ncbi:MAG: hypothetical protein OXE87_15890 [Chloroflexi bacterium]|nr:hypothetical protein [Chloroflexota bacterium]
MTITASVVHAAKGGKRKLNLRNARGFSDNIPKVNTARMGNEITVNRL